MVDQYLKQRLEETGLTEKDLALTFKDDQGKTVKGSYLSPSKDGGIIINYPSLNGQLKTFARGKKEIRYQVERIHPSKVTDGKKYKNPYGAGTELFITPTVRSAYNEARKICTLYVIEGQFKALVGSKYGLHIIAISGIHNIKDREAGRLFPEIVSIVEKCTVSNIVFLMDGDLHKVTYKDEDTNLAERPTSFFSAVKNFKEKVKSLSVDAYLIHPNTDSQKGLDDLLAANKGKEGEIIEDLEGFTDKEPNYFKSFKLGSDSKLKRLFCLHDISEFYNLHKDEIGTKPFSFWHKKYQFDGKQLVLIAGKPTQTATKAQAAKFWLNNQGIEIRFNLITQLYELNGKELDNRQTNTLYLKINAAGILAGKELVHSLIESDATPEYNPLTEFFESHENIKVSGKIAALAASVDQSTYTPEFWETLLTKWMVGAVAALEPGKRNILELVLQGNQDTGKSYFFERLLPEELSDYFAYSRLDGDKDADILICQKLLILDDEYGGKSKLDAKRHKELISKRSVTVRLPYGRHPITMQRVATFAGTTNDENILSDPTGNRRVIPVKVLSRNFDAYDAIDKTQLWMEAYHLAKSGFDYQLTKEEVSQLNENTGDFQTVTAEAENLFHHIGKPDENETMQTSYMTTTEIRDYLERVSNSRHRLSLKALGMELSSQGFNKTTKRIRGNPAKVWHVAKLTPESLPPLGM